MGGVEHLPKFSGFLSRNVFWDLDYDRGATNILKFVSANLSPHTQLVPT